MKQPRQQIVSKQKKVMAGALATAPVYAKINATNINEQLLKGTHQKRWHAAAI
jgi:hypothetical protein